MSITATCLTLAALLAQARGGETFRFNNNCGPILLSAKPARVVTVDARGSTVRGLTITGANIVWKGGTIRAAAGAFASGPPGYGALVRGGINVRFDQVFFTAAKKALVVDNARAVMIADSQFYRVGEDGVIAARSSGLTIVRTRFSNTIGKPTECRVSGRLVLSLPRRTCVAQEGVWTDGFHPDAVQIRDGMTDVLLEGNIVEGSTQGLSQMDTTGDAPLRRIVIRGNTVKTDAYHRITLGDCVECFITGNTVARAPRSSKRAVIIAGSARECGNRVEDGLSFPC